MKSGSSPGLAEEALEEEEGGREGRRGVKKDWSERRDSRA
jgi:hypothetical protein